MILRSFSRPQRQRQRQLQAALSSIAPYKQRCAASTNTCLLSSCSPAPRRRERKHPSVSARRGLTTQPTQPTGFEGHRLPVLPHGETYGEHGVDGFLSPEGFDLAWTQYQSMILEKLNSLTMGTADATTKPQKLVERYGRSSDQASLFNHASMACNNHTFFNCLSPQKTEPSTTFASDIEDSFSSYDTLRIEMIETADAMFGPGFVWIVQDQEMGKMKLLCTYLAGSPFPLAHFRSQQNDMATFNTNAPNASRFMSGPTNHVGSFGPHSRANMGNQRAPGGYSSYPILCVNTWEHAYLRDYGIGGKRAYLERWWDRVDWAVVERNAKVYGPERRGFASAANLSNYMGHSFQRHQPLTTQMGGHVTK